MRILVLGFATLVMAGATASCRSDRGEDEPQLTLEDERAAATHVLAGARRAVEVSGSLGDFEFARFTANASGPGGPDYQVTVTSTTGGRARLDFSMGFSAATGPDDGWVRTAPTEAPTALTDTLEAFVRGHDMLMNAFHPERRYGPLRYAGEQTFEEIPAIRLDGTDPLGSPVEFYYARQDTIPIGFRQVDHLRGRGPVATSLSEWRMQDGIRFPGRARIVQGTEVFHYEIFLIETAATTDSTAFDP